MQFKKFLKHAVKKILASRYCFEKDIPLSNIRAMHIISGKACNQRCKMCFQDNFHAKLNANIYTEKLLPIYPSLKEVILQGGEPTILPEVKEFIEFLVPRYPQIKFSIFTNGSKFDEYWIDTFIKHGTSVNFSLNAVTKKTYDTITKYGDWENVIANLKQLVLHKKANHSKLQIFASFVILDENLHELADFFIFAKDLGVDRVRYFYDLGLLPGDTKLVAGQVEKVHQLEKEFPEIRVESLDSFEAWSLHKKQPIPEPCSVIFNQIFVNETGDVFFCCHYGLPLGNLNISSMEEIWNSLPAKMGRKLVSDRNYCFCGQYCRSHIGHGGENSFLLKLMQQ